MARTPPAVLELSECARRVVTDNASAQIDVLSYNVLLPNSEDGWWISKYYNHSHAPDTRAWPWRRRLLQEQILGDAKPTIVCLQEVSPISFDNDFHFMKEAGYKHELLNKGRMRNATFWDPAHLERISVACKDRTLICRFALVGQVSTTFYVANCHLSAGPQPKRRLTQIHQVTDTIRKKLTKERSERECIALSKMRQKKKKEKRKKGRIDQEQKNPEELKSGNTTVAVVAEPVPAPEGKTPVNVPSLSEYLQSANIIICGDFNAQGDTGVRQLLTQGHVLPSFRESGDPAEENHPCLTSKKKSHPFSFFEDVYCSAFAATPTVKPPATLICPQLKGKMVDPRSGSATPAMIKAWRAMFDKLRKYKPLMGNVSSGEMSREAVDAWLIKINGVLGRGSEFRAAYHILDGDSGMVDGGRGESKTTTVANRTSKSSFSFEEFCSVYQSELDQGKFWGVEHDIVAILGADGGFYSPGSPPFCARFDQMYSSTTSTMRCTYVKKVLTDKHRCALLETCETIIPNEWHPSDHLALRAGFSLRLLGE